jgi:hypothetical protein
MAEPEQIDLRSEILTLLDAQPFVNFRIIMTSGDRYEITERHQVAVGTSAIVVYPPKSTHSWLRLNQISSVDVLETV